MRRKFKEHPVIYRQKMEISIPSLSMLLLTSDDDVELEQTMIAELVFWNYKFEMKKYHDYRKDVDITSHSLQVLRLKSQKHGPQMQREKGFADKNGQKQRDCQSYVDKNQIKSVVMGHISAANYLVTDEDFYKFNIE